MTPAQSSAWTSPRHRRPHGRRAGHPTVIQDVAYIGYLVETKAPQGPYFEAAVIHRTDCGSGLLADEPLRRDFAGRSAPQISGQITVSGHVYVVITGLLTTIAEPQRPHLGTRTKKAAVPGR